MRGKCAFVLGAALGYVLGTRAGRERYEQIKRGAQKVWNTPPVQRGVEAVKEAAGNRVDELKAAAVQAGRDAFASFTRASQSAPQRTGSGRPTADQVDETEETQTASDDGMPQPPAEAAGGAGKSGSGKSASGKAGAAKTGTSKSTAHKSGSSKSGAAKGGTR